MADDEGTTAARDTESPASRKKPSTPRQKAREPPVNGIEASRRPKKARGSSPPAPSQAPTVPEAPVTVKGDFDPWTVPQSVRDRFVQDGNRFYFPDGAAAFKDLGRRLTTVSENTEVVQSLIEIAHSRGWTEVTVTGTERFRQEAWRQARLAGLGVRGYRPTQVEHAQLIRALGRRLPGGAERVDALSEGPPPGSAPAVPASAASPVGSPTTDPSRDRVSGRLLDHGRDAYRHDLKKGPSYFVRLQTADGAREIWGKDIDRAMAKSLTQPQIGDEVILQRTGQDTVLVKRQERDGQGQLVERDVEAQRNRWVIEKREFFEKRARAAQVVRDAAIAPRQAVRQHPELAGTYLNLRAAELASRALRDAEDQKRFITQVRRALADDIERGEALQPVRLREWTRRPEDRAAAR